MKFKNNPITKKEEIAQNPDNKIDEDFKGYPYGQANDENIKPETKQQKAIADINNRDGEKRLYKNNKADEHDSDGSANALEGK